MFESHINKTQHKLKYNIIIVWHLLPSAQAPRPFKFIEFISLLFISCSIFLTAFSFESYLGENIHCKLPKCVLHVILGFI